LLRRGRIDVAEDRQQVVELGVGQAGSSLHLTLVSAVHPHGLAASIDFCGQPISSFIKEQLYYLVSADLLSQGIFL
jgi:hypothetical protein